MPSSRCKGRNLINHCHQVSKPKDLEVEYLQVKDYTGPSLDEDFFHYPKKWVCTLSFGSETFRSYSINKLSALELVLSLADESIRKQL